MLSCERFRSDLTTVTQLTYLHTYLHKSTVHSVLHLLPCSWTMLSCEWFRSDLTTVTQLTYLHTYLHKSTVHSVLHLLPCSWTMLSCEWFRSDLTTVTQSYRRRAAGPSSWVSAEVQPVSCGPQAVDNTCDTAQIPASHFRRRRAVGLESWHVDDIACCLC